MTQINPPASQAFAYDAQTEAGQPISGIINAPDADGALQRLQMLRLRVTRIDPATSTPARPLRGEAFAAFNQQLAQLTKAGLPIERGLRLIAIDMKRGKLARTIQLVADELESGTPLPEAFARHKDKFPSLYSQLVEAGVRSGNLSGVLLSLGRHIETEQRLRGTLWRSLAYPLMVITGLVLVVLFISVAVIPQLNSVYSDFHIRLPEVTLALLAISHAMRFVAIIGLVAIIAAPLIWAVLRMAGKDRAAIDALVLPIPLVGSVMRFSLVARFLDAARIAADAGMNLPAAISLASDATGSPGIRRDGMAMIEALGAGQPLSSARTRVIPATVPAAMEFSSGNQQLPATLATLSEMYMRQSDLRMQMIPTAITPTAVVLIALMVGFVIIGLFAPLISLLKGLGV